MYRFNFFKIAALVCFAFFATKAQAQVTLSSEKNLVDGEAIRRLRMKKEGLGSIQPVKDVALPTLLVSTDVHAETQYSLSAKIPLKSKNLQKGSKVLIVFEAKTELSSLETGEAKVLWQLRFSDDNKERIANIVSIGAEWQTYYIPIEIPKYTPKDKLILAMQFGFPPQKFQIRNIGLYHFDKSVALSDLPKTTITYAGMESDAVWRKDAFARIDSLRKGQFSLKMTQNGQPLENVGLDIKMVKPFFRWGAAVGVKDVKDNETYQDKITAGFNQIVFENDLKMKHFGNRQSQSDILKAMNQLQKKGISIKGHVLLWPGFQYLPEQFEKQKENPKKIRQMALDHVEDILKATEGKITHWDVVNEANTNTDLQDITGSEDILYEPFRILKNKYPKIGRYVNEYGIISKGGLNKEKQTWYYNYIKRIDENTEGAVDGIGIQCHIGTDLTPPEKVLSILDYYGTLGKKISISEFTMDIQDPILRKIYTEDFLIAAYSHPAVDEFLFWGLQADKKGKVDIYNADWSLGAMGKAFFGLAHQLWTTELSTTTDKTGEISASGFYGTYEYNYLINGQVRTGKFKHLPGQKTVVIIDIP